MTTDEPVEQPSSAALNYDHQTLTQMAKREFVLAVVKWGRLVLAEEKCQLDNPQLINAREVISIAMELDVAEVPADWRSVVEATKAPSTPEHEKIAAGIAGERAMACSRAGTFSTKTPKPGQAKAGDGSGKIIDPVQIAVARELYLLALRLDPSLSFRFSVAALSEKLADYALAIEQANQAESGYRLMANQLIGRCQAQIAKGAKLEIKEAIRQDRQGSVEASALRAKLGLDDARSIAMRFAHMLAAAEFEAACTLLSDTLTSDGSVTAGRFDAKKLQRRYQEMTSGEPAFHIEALEASDALSGHESADLGWVYVAIRGANFNEAVTVIVANENGVGRIRSIEWGRP